MDIKKLPDRPSLEQYSKQAKELVKACAAGVPGALERTQQLRRRPGNKLTLADAQWTIAREHGFETWVLFAQHIESLTLPDSPSAIWEAARDATIRGDEAALELLLNRHGAMLRKEQPPPYGTRGLRPDYSEGDARAILVREHDFASWEKFAEYKRALQDADSPIARFEAAVEAVVTGDAPALERLLRENPDLVRARSRRRHRSTLLHYVGSNGVESFHQRCPKNIVAVTEILLQHGAEVDAEADMYGGGQTALGLAATSIHPVHAGVLIPLLETLLKAGAAIDGPQGSSAVNACLANGRAQAAEFLARHGARLDFEGAAGVGRMDLVRSLFESATASQVKDGFAWACEFGRTEAVEFLLDRGMDVGARLRHHGQTGLHWAAGSAHADTVKLLLQRKAPVDAPDETWGGTPLSWALFGWKNPPPDTPPERYFQVVVQLVAAGATVQPEWLADETLRADAELLAALVTREP